MTTIDPKSALETIEKFQQMADNHLKNLIPWDKMKEQLVLADTFKKDYSDILGESINSINNNIKEAKLQYNLSNNAMIKLCQNITNYITTFRILVSKDKSAEINQAILLKFKDFLIESSKGIDEVLTSFIKCLTELEFLEVAFKTTRAIVNEALTENSEWHKRAVAQIRATAYGTAIVGAVLGLFGLAISYGIASGVVENDIIPQLNQKMLTIKDNYTNFGNLLTDLKTQADKAKNQITEDIKLVRIIQGESQNLSLLIDLYNLIKSDVKASLDRLHKVSSLYVTTHL